MKFNEKKIKITNDFQQRIENKRRVINKSHSLIEQMNLTLIYTSFRCELLEILSCNIPRTFVFLFFKTVLCPLLFETK